MAFGQRLGVARDALDLEVGDVAQRLGDDLVARGEVVGRRRQRDAGLAGHRAVGDAVDAVAADEADRRLDDRGADGLGRRAADGGGHLTVVYSTVVLTRACRIARRCPRPPSQTAACPAAASWPRARARSCARSAASASCSASPATRRRPTPPRAAWRRRAPARPPPRPGAGPTEQLTFTTPQPQPGGTAREYWIAGARRAVGHRAVAPAARRVARARGRRAERLPRLRLPADDRGLRRAAGRAGHPGADALRRGRRHDRRALPQRPLREDRPGADHAPARGQVQPRVRRRLPRRLHARGRLRAPRPRVHLHVGGDARRRRRVALPRPRAQPHAQHLPRALRRAHRARARREGPRRRGRPLLPRARAAGHRPRAPVPVHQRPRLRRQHADAAGPRSARTSPST